VSDCEELVGVTHRGWWGCRSPSEEASRHKSGTI